MTRNILMIIPSWWAILNQNFLSDTFSNSSNLVLCSLNGAAPLFLFCTGLTIKQTHTSFYSVFLYFPFHPFWCTGLLFSVCITSKPFFPVTTFSSLHSSVWPCILNMYHFWRQEFGVLIVDFNMLPRNLNYSSRISKNILQSYWDNDFGPGATGPVTTFSLSP